MLVRRGTNRREQAQRRVDLQPQISKRLPDKGGTCCTAAATVELAEAAENSCARAGTGAASSRIAAINRVARMLIRIMLPEWMYRATFTLG
jgi:hypothetical protein